jgi:branched-chain amino acid transport system substrate-binding protein
MPCAYSKLLSALFATLASLTSNIQIAAAQTVTPYASIPSGHVTYLGPGRGHQDDLPAGSIRIGLLVPLTGPRKSEGEAILAAARIALDESQLQAPGVSLAIGDETASPWGPTAGTLIHLVMDEQVVAIITSENGAVAHLTEQVGNRIGVPVLTLATDSTTTETNLRWLFRLAPSDAAQAGAFVNDIYSKRHSKRVLLVTTRDHDGRVGAGEFLAAVRDAAAPAPSTFTVDPQKPDLDAWSAALKRASPQVIVFWTSASLANSLRGRMHSPAPGVRLYLSQATADGYEEPDAYFSQTPGEISDSQAWTVASRPIGPGLARRFAELYRAKTHANPGPAALEAFDAVRLICDSLQKSGPNRARLRDGLAEVSAYSGASGVISFDSQGNNQQPLRLVPVDLPASRE